MYWTTSVGIPALYFHQVCQKMFKNPNLWHLSLTITHSNNAVLKEVSAEINESYCWKVCPTVMIINRHSHDSSEHSVTSWREYIPVVERVSFPHRSKPLTKTQPEAFCSNFTVAKPILKAEDSNILNRKIPNQLHLAQVPAQCYFFLSNIARLNAAKYKLPVSRCVFNGCTASKYKTDLIRKSYYGILTAHLLIFSSSSLEYDVWMRSLATRNNAACLWAINVSYP